MFEGSAAQLLCIVETLHDNNRRTILHSPPAAEHENEIWDIYAELFLAATELLKGKPTICKQINLTSMNGVVLNECLMDMAERGEDGATVECVYKLTASAYNFEQWEIFDYLLPNLRNLLEEISDQKYAALAKQLEIIEAIDKVMPRQRPKKYTTEVDDIDPMQDVIPASAIGGKAGPKTDDMIKLAEVLLSVINSDFQPSSFDVDMVIDACLILWSQCKRIFQRFQTGSSDNSKYLKRMPNPGKWTYILEIVHKLFAWCGLNKVDPALSAEVVLRLALVLEANASQQISDNSRIESTIQSPTRQQEDGTVDEEGSVEGISNASYDRGNSPPSILKNTIRNQLTQAKDMLQLGIDNICWARRMTAVTDGSHIADVSWVLEYFRKESKTESAVWNMVKDLHAELLFIYHRVCIKLLEFDKGISVIGKKRTTGRNMSTNLEQLVGECQQYLLSKAILLLQASVHNNLEGSKRKLLTEAKKLIETCEKEEKKLYAENHLKDFSVKKKSKIPPPPILLTRTDRMMVFKPSPWEPANGEVVAYYSIFGRAAVGHNLKARLSDYHLAGSGEVVPASSDCELRVDDLQPNSKYIFAVGAYTADGKLIGNSIGETTSAIVASHPIPLLMAWAYLCQAAYQVQEFELAREASSVLWKHFIAPDPPHLLPTYIEDDRNDLRLNFYSLNKEVLERTSPVLLRLFQNSLFIDVESSVESWQLYCDDVGSKDVLTSNQIMRFRCCEKMLVSLELAGWLNDASYALQATVQSYGLLAPILQHKITARYVVEVLQIAHSVLGHTAPSIGHRKNTDSFKHMIAVVTFHLAKVFRKAGERSLASSVNDLGRKMLAVFQKESTKEEEEIKADGEGADDDDGKDHGDERTETGSVTLQVLKRKTIRKTKKALWDEAEATGNEELKALEAHMSYMQRQRK